MNWSILEYFVPFFFKGAWTRIFSYQNNEEIADDLTTNVTDEMSLFLKRGSGRYISMNALKNLVESGLYQQIRFYCTSKIPGRTIHLKTLLNENGKRVLEGYALSEKALVSSCGSFEVYQDDTSYVSRHCEEWIGRDNSRTEHAGYWNYFYPHKLFTSPIFIPSRHNFLVGYLPHIWTYCDNHGHRVHGKWEVLIR